MAVSVSPRTLIYSQSQHFTRWCKKLTLFEGAGFLRAGLARFFPILGCFEVGVACSGPRAVHLWTEADAILSPRWGGWAGVTIVVDYWWATPGGRVLNNMIFELAMETTPLGARF